MDKLLTKGERRGLLNKPLDAGDLKSIARDFRALFASHDEADALLEKLQHEIGVLTDMLKGDDKKAHKCTQCGESCMDTPYCGHCYDEESAAVLAAEQKLIEKDKQIGELEGRLAKTINDADRCRIKDALRTGKLAKETKKLREFVEGFVDAFGAEADISEWYEKARALLARKG